MESLLFVIFALSAIGGAVAVVVSQNVVRMAFYLVISLGSTAGLFFLLHAGFVGATQLLIYVGGTVVLLIFGVMLTASGPYVTIRSSSAELMQASVIGILLLGTLLFAVFQVNWSISADEMKSQYGTGHADRPGFNPSSEGNSVIPIGTALLGLRFDEDWMARDLDERPAVGYLLPFEIVSVHLLVVLVGAAYLARTKRRANPDRDPASASSR